MWVRPGRTQLRSGSPSEVGKQEDSILHVDSRLIDVEGSGMPSVDAGPPGSTTISRAGSDTKAEVTLKDASVRFTRQSMSSPSWGSRGSDTDRGGAAAAWGTRC